MTDKVDFQELGDAAFPDGRVKLLAWYLPQFHPIPENDLAWQKGFTEWTNAAKAAPRFPGHYQPRLPGALGFYDLRLKEVMTEQMQLARHSGIYGFCMHHYWFGGKRVLRAPLDHLRENPDLDFRFCLHWANEPWTKRWDGLHGEIILDQAHSPEDDLAFIEDIAWAFSDARYIRHEGKPMLGIYRPALLPNMAATAGRWREYCRKQGIGEIFLFAAAAFKSNDRPPSDYGVDAFVEYPPHNCPAPIETGAYLPPGSPYGGTVRDYVKLRDLFLEKSQAAYSTLFFRGVMPGWDNSARSETGMILVNAEPPEYGTWLRGALALATGDQYPGERYLFINAWNEWAEAAYLEPDNRYGFAWLNETAQAVDAAPTGLPHTLVVVDFKSPAHVAQARQTLEANVKAPGFRPVVLSLAPVRNIGTFEGLAPLIVAEEEADAEAIAARLAARGYQAFALCLYLGKDWQQDQPRLAGLAVKRAIAPPVNS